MRECVRAVLVHDERILVMRRNKYGDEYYTLLGGGIDANETREQAVVRELREESGLSVEPQRLLFTESSYNPAFGTQYIYLCRLTGEAMEPRLAVDSEETREFLEGDEHTPLWIAIKNFPGLPFRSSRLHAALIDGLRYGFSDVPATLDSENSLALHMEKEG